jgi:hypothetical protein
MARGFGGRAGRGGTRRRMGRLSGCLLWVLALLVILLVLSILFGGFQKGTKVGGDRLARPQASSSVR